jgi:hypothetical protein
MLVWNMNLNSTYAKVVSYKIYTHKETSSAPLPRFDLWREYKTVSAFDLPMACKLTNVNIILITFENNLILIKIVLVSQ